jgi:hypothetical protein
LEQLGATPERADCKQTLSDAQGTAKLHEVIHAGKGGGKNRRHIVSERASQGQSGGVNITGTIGSVGGDIVGRDKITGAISEAVLDNALRPLSDAIATAPTETRTEAEAVLAALKREVAKGPYADDGVLAKILDGLVGLIPQATSAVVSAFATPILGGIVGPVTGFVLNKLRGK